jgi:TonB family protein
MAMPRPSYPAAAKAEGIEGTVIIKYVVTESGQVTNVRVVRGPQALRAVCVAAVKRWRFKPAKLEGRPVAVHRVARFPFRIRT